MDKQIENEYKIESIENFRDLGGIRTNDGKTVKKRKLFRSAALHDASEEDIRRIKELGIDTIIDFRSCREADVHRDPEIDGVAYYNLSLFRERERHEGVERTDNDEPFYEMMIKASYDHPTRFAEHLSSAYRNLVSDEVAIAGYTRFFEILASEECDKVLWHCSAGKDRTGIAAVLLLEALGADRQMIRENYLLTNLHLGRTLNEILGKVDELASKHENYEIIRDSFKTALSASEDFIDTCYETMKEQAGSPLEFLETYLHVDEEMRKKLKEKYCE
ncbi:MAG: tyrosine-protein phosphatase [Erysipelotrichaceae bacterium]|nr:tyrosine-protein phosphatase [Erysipelotrichaceae bacterium]